MKEIFEALLNNKWTQAKTAVKNPHQYTLKKDWKDPVLFEFAVLYIRAYGYNISFWGKPYVCFDLNGMRYWTMGFPVEETILINRAFNEKKSRYDDVAVMYEGLFAEEQYKQEDRELIEKLNIQKGDSVLDIGCGTGLLLDYVDKNTISYCGLDPSYQMLRILKEKHGENYNTYPCPVEEFIPPRKYSKIVSLYGSMNYAGPESIAKLSQMVEMGGDIVLVMFKDDYIPVTHTKSGVEIPYNKTSLYQFPDNAQREDFHNYEIIRWRSE